MKLGALTAIATTIFTVFSALAAMSSQGPSLSCMSDLFFYRTEYLETRPYNPENVIDAYRRGWLAYPDQGWFELPEQSVLDFTGPRTYRIGKNDLKFLRDYKKKGYKITQDENFEEVLFQASIMPRSFRQSEITAPNWITREVIETHLELFKQGLAHSFEVWHNGELVAGVFGVMVDGVFRAESMFRRLDLRAGKNAGKLAMKACIDWQISQGATFMDLMEGNNDLMNRWGAYKIPHEEFENRIEVAKSHLLEREKSREERR